jgi:thiol-disulfide isomerase/thioredoxin
MTGEHEYLALRRVLNSHLAVVGSLHSLMLVMVMAGCARPELELADGSGSSWEQWQGQWLIINYWAEWCAPCRKEIPELNELHHDGADAGVVVLGVNFDGCAARL